MMLAGCGPATDDRRPGLGRVEVVEAGTPAASQRTVEPKLDFVTPAPGSVFPPGTSVEFRALLALAAGERLPTVMQLLVLNGDDVIIQTGKVAVDDRDDQGRYNLSGRIVAPAATGRYKIRIQMFWSKVVREGAAAGESRDTVVDSHALPFQVSKKGKS
ncbi:hypothetical protein [Planctomyces sp. SH-PL62]|uniref:hypothetical protein n=1 Tax=Planctomyces sp. SH-PL62 TaxID=1636152 RepID=UPI0012E880CA|nr:hypothetical protein [Planctomyces sp. SH-PL62]